MNMWALDQLVNGVISIIQYKKKNAGLELKDLPHFITHLIDKDVNISWEGAIKLPQ